MNTPHVQTCQECQAQIARLREEVTQLRVALGLIEPPPIEPPPSLFTGADQSLKYGSEWHRPYSWWGKDRPGDPPPRIGIL
jgi:hypothetical protein